MFEPSQQMAICIYQKLRSVKLQAMAFIKSNKPSVKRFQSLDQAGRQSLPLSKKKSSLNL